MGEFRDLAAQDKTARTAKAASERLRADAFLKEMVEMLLEKSVAPFPIYETNGATITESREKIGWFSSQTIETATYHHLEIASGWLISHSTERGAVPKNCSTLLTEAATAHFAMFAWHVVSPEADSPDITSVPAICVNSLSDLDPGLVISNRKTGFSKHVMRLLEVGDQIEHISHPQS